MGTANEPQGRIGPPFISAEQWRCVVCGHVDHWGPDWQWYGTLDDPPDIVTCSAGCRGFLPYPLTVVGGAPHRDRKLP